VNEPVGTLAELDTERYTKQDTEFNTELEFEAFWCIFKTVCLSFSVFLASFVFSGSESHLSILFFCH